MAMANLLHLLARPLHKYNQLLESRPWTTKCITSGVMYAAGDACAQLAEHHNENAERVKQGEAKQGFKGFDLTRMGIFLVFGTLIGGPAYTAWFGWLDQLPAKLYAMRQIRQRAEILRAYNMLKRHGIEVNLRMDK